MSPSNLQVNFNIKYNGICKVYIYRKYQSAHVSIGSILTNMYGLYFCDNKKLKECCYKEFCYKNSYGTDHIKISAVRNFIKKSFESTNAKFFSQILASNHDGPLNDGRFIDLFSEYVTCDCWNCYNSISTSDEGEIYYSDIDYSKHELILTTKNRWEINTIRSPNNKHFKNNMFTYEIDSYYDSAINPCGYTSVIPTLGIIFKYIFIGEGLKEIRIEKLKNMKEYKPF